MTPQPKDIYVLINFLAMIRQRARFLEGRLRVNLDLIGKAPA